MNTTHICLKILYPYRLFCGINRCCATPAEVLVFTKDMTRVLTSAKAVTEVLVLSKGVTGVLISAIS